MAIIDIVILLMLVGFVTYGIIRGFTRSLLSLCGWLLGLIISICLARPFASLLEIIFPFDRWLGEPVLDLLLKNKFLSIAIPQTESEISAALTGAGIPNFLANILTPAVKGVIPALSDQSITLAEVIAPAITHCVVLVISFILLNIILRIALIIVQHIVQGLMEKFALINAIDKTLGGVFGFIKFVFVVFAVIMILTPLKNYEFMNWYKEDVEKSTIGQFVEDNNFLASWLFGGIKKYVGEDEKPKDNETEENNSSFVQNENHSEIYKIITSKNELLDFDYIDLNNFRLIKET